LPDTLLMVLTVALMHQTLSLMQDRAGGSTAQWLVLGLLLGLAGLSKYTAVFEALAVVVCVLRVHGLQLLRRAAVWGAVALALVLIAPVLVWNAQNHWISFAYQAQHGAGSIWQAAHVLRFLAVQLVVYGPLLLWGVAALVLSAWRRALPYPTLALFFVIPMLLFTYLAGGGSSLPHWTAPAWVALAPFAGWALARVWYGLEHGGSRWVLGTLAAVQGVLSLALPVLMLTAGAPFIAASRGGAVDAVNPFADVHGWQAAGERVRVLASERQLHSVSVQNWTLASRIGWYARPLPVHVLEDRFDQFDLWAGDLPQGGDTLLLDWSHMAYDTPLGAHGFARCELLETVPVQRWGQRIATFTLYDCRNWLGDPQPHLRTQESTP
jgi:4-amino-4-deoxy-L-arabinose transferase-like glycosyltransferase